jgi:hypothetical protein
MGAAGAGRIAAVSRSGKAGVRVGLAQVKPRLVDARRSAEEVVALGWPAAFVREVWRRVARASFKRRMPPVAKVSLRAIEQDFLYPRDWGK